MAQHRTLATIAVAAAIALLAGCSARTPDAAGPTGGHPGDHHPGAQISGALTVYAAASLTDSFDAIARVFMERNPGVTVTTVYDGSSTLATQVVEGAPADVFASADERTMAHVADAGLIAGKPQAFASNVLEIAVQPGNPLHIGSLQDLAAPSRLVVLCAPAVPCGAASARLLARAGVHVNAVSEEQNVTAVVTKVALGEADAGLVYATDVLAAGPRVDGIRIPGAAAVTNAYLIGQPTAAPHPAAAQAFMRLVLSRDGHAILAGDGFGPR